MRILTELAFFLVALGGGGGTAVWYFYRKQHPLAISAPDKCKHRRWSKWKIEQIKTIHVYPDIDDGAELPDRVDTYMTRECMTCGLPQAKTVRGIDSSQFK